MLFNWMLSMAILMTPMAIAEMSKMVIFAIMATIVKFRAPPNILLAGNAVLES